MNTLVIKTIPIKGLLNYKCAIKEIKKNLKNHLVKKLIGYKDKNTHDESVFKTYECIDSKNNAIVL